jgi:2'-5' RNA ligase
MIVMLECVFKGSFEIFHNEILNEIENLFGFNFVKKENLPTHITLKYPFEIQNLEELENVLKEFSQNHSQEKLFASSFNHFNKKTIFIDIIPSEEAKKIIGNLVNSLKQISWIQFNELEKNDLHLHSTIIMDCENKFQEVMDFLDSKKFNFKLDLDNISIIKELPSDSNIRKWELYKTYYLG